MSQEEEPSEVVQQLSRLGQLVETHASWVFIGSKFVFKFKKPVDFGFLDFSSLDKRKRACDAELRLNARLAPSVYLGVVPVRSGQQSGLWVDDPDAISAVGSRGDPADPIADYAVKMHRLPDERRADHLLEQGKLGQDEIERLAILLAEFHAQSTCNEEISRYGQPDAVAGNVRENFDQTRGWITDYVDRRTEGEIENHQLGFLRERKELLQERVAQQRVRDGHGDLRLDHVYLSDSEIDVIDCIEFNDRFRYADTAADLAFLVMDLSHRGRRDLAEWLMARYASASGDYEAYRLIDFYEGYRAYVRGKVTALLHQQSRPRNDELAQKARSYFLHALVAQKPSLQPARLICVGGLIASGKSTVARRIARALCCPTVDTDSTRKRLMGVPLDQPLGQGAFQGAYGDEVSERVHDTVLHHAGDVLGTGRSIIIDASFRKKSTRARAFDLAKRHDVPLSFVECTVPEPVAKTRLHQRASAKTVSDARADLYDTFRRSFEAVDELQSDSHLLLDTSRSLEEQNEQLRRFGLPPRK